MFYSLKSSVTLQRLLDWRYWSNTTKKLSWISIQETSTYNRCGPGEPRTGRKECINTYGISNWLWTDHDCDDMEWFLCETDCEGLSIDTI